MHIRVKQYGKLAYSTSLNMDGNCKLRLEFLIHDMGVSQSEVLRELIIEGSDQRGYQGNSSQKSRRVHIEEEFMVIC